MIGALTREAFVSISSNRLRTFLAMLGIMIGVSSVVALVAIGTGSSRQVEEAISKLGSNILIVTPGARDSKGIMNNEFSQLTAADADAIAEMYGVLAAAPVSSTETLQVLAGHKNWRAPVTGTTSDFFYIRDWPLEDGAYFEDDDMRLSKRVAIIGKTIAKELYGLESPVGRNIRIQQLAFKVIGVLEEKGQSLSGRNQDENVYVPLTTMQRKVKGGFFADRIRFVFVKMANDEWLEPASDDIVEMLREKHNTRPAAKDPFSVSNLAALTETTSQTSKALSYLLSAIASISLIVGGVGIMNIMLVTVTERTREIGIRKAIGATNSQIMWQFLLESVAITTAGSIIGLLLGIAAALFVEDMFGMQAAMTLWSVVIAMGVAIIVGILSGLYPARRASKLQPIDALRQVGG